MLDPGYKQQQDLHQIILRWRKHQFVVTYGTASATYLAVRTIFQLARDEGDNFPLARDVLLRDFYMDDLISGDDDIKGALLIQTQLTALLA